jgi:hypothetical protein
MARMGVREKDGGDARGAGGAQRRPQLLDVRGPAWPRVDQHLDRSAAHHVRAHRYQGHTPISTLTHAVSKEGRAPHRPCR